MNIRVIINILLIIVVLHLILRNFLTDRFSQIDSFSGYGEDDSMKFLTSSDGNLEEFSGSVNSPYVNKLTDYVNQCKPVDVKPGNWYATDENNPNFTSNVLNVNKFYNVDSIGQYDGLSADQIIPKNFVEPPISNNQENNMLEKVSEQTCFNQKIGETHENTDLYKPDAWSYKGELAMNGGQIGGDGLVGYNNLESAYATYQGPGSETCDPSKPFPCHNNFASRPDDLRFGLGLPNKEYRETN